MPPRCRIADAASTIGSALAAGWKRTFHFWAHTSGPAGLRPMEAGYTPKTTPKLGFRVLSRPAWFAPQPD